MDNTVPIDDDMDEQDYYSYNEVYTVIVPTLDETQDIIVRLGMDNKYDPEAWTLLGAYGDEDGEVLDINIEQYCMAIELVQTIHRRLI